MRKFTAFNKLYIFSIVAKHLSFSKAASELFITQAAVSQQIKSLEEILECSLFKRLNKKIILTSKGHKLLTLIGDIFTQLQIGIHSQIEEENSGVLNIGAIPSFAMKWLIPRLNKFNELHPEIDIHIAASIKQTDFSIDDIDLVIRHGHRSDNYTHHIRLMDETVFLVANPSILKKKPINAPKDLLKHNLLYDEIDCQYEMYGVAREVTWNDFANKLNINIKNNHSLIFSQAHLVLQAAITGQGVAITRSALVEDELASGALVKVFPECVIKSPGYDIVYPKTSENTKKIQLFTDWLLAEAETKTEIV